MAWGLNAQVITPIPQTGYLFKAEDLKILFIARYLSSIISPSRIITLFIGT